MKEKSITIMILVAIALFITLISIPLIAKNNKSVNKENFPEYNEPVISEKSVKSSSTLEDVKKALEKSYYFNKLAVMGEYDKKTYSPAMLQDLLWYFIFNYEISNSKYFSYYEKDQGKYCFSKNNLIAAFKELYGIDITNQYDYFEGYYKYVSMSYKGYCFDFRKVASEYDNNIKIGVRDLSAEEGMVTTDLYVYEYTARSENEKKYESLLSNAIDNKDYNKASTIVKSYLNGTVKHKQLQFEQNRKGKFFKYKILLSKTLAY